jgi:hypothetical protein
MKIEVLDPSHESGAAAFVLAPRRPALHGATVGIISNGKRNTVPFFDAYEKELRETYGVANVVRRIKSNYSAPADPVIIEEAHSWDIVVAGIGD